MALSDMIDCLDKPDVVLNARIRTRNGSVSDIDINDLSIAGCLIDRRSLPLNQEERVLIRLGDLSYMPAMVSWVEDNQAGLIFETELYEPVRQHLLWAYTHRRQGRDAQPKPARRRRASVT